MPAPILKLGEFVRLHDARRRVEGFSDQVRRSFDSIDFVGPVGQEAIEHLRHAVEYIENAVEVLTEAEASMMAELMGKQEGGKDD